MSFISFEFLLFLLVTCVLYYIIPKKIRWSILLIASYVFYILSSAKLTAFLIVTTVSIYVAALLISRADKLKEKITDLPKEEKKKIKKKIKVRKKIILLVAILINIGILAVLKYSPFFAEIATSILKLFKVEKSLVVTHFMLPLGISYYTLQAISYIVDVYRGKYEADKNIARVALYMSFFPLMVEGPISKYDELATQLYEPHKFDAQKVKMGMELIAWGFFKKLIIADRVGILVDNVFGHAYGSYVALIAIVLYTLQIYSEFSGCMDIVMGVGELFGVKLTRNFNRPFFAKSIQEFWRRWHITLGVWLKEYVFYPISLSKMNLSVCGFANKHLTKYLSKFITIAFPLFFVWFANGIWHGASWKYVLYGLYYYVIMMLGVLFQPVFDKIISLFKINTKVFSYRFFQMIRTTLFVFIGMTMFRADSMGIAINMLKSVVTAKPGISILALGMSIGDFVVAFMGTLIIFVISLLQEKSYDIRETLEKQNLVFRWLVYICFIVLIVIFGVYGVGYDATSFIYGGF